MNAAEKWPQQGPVLPTEDALTLAVVAARAFCGPTSTGLHFRWEKAPGRLVLERVSG